MTQEEKAQRYDKAIEIAKNWHIDAQIDFKKSLETLFPELKCNNEKIRKEIIECVKNYGPSSANPQLFKNMLTWLEKQGEQNHVEWSEEDIEMLNSTISFVEHSAFTTIGKGKNNVISWLKSLKDKVQPKTEWSEEDEKMYRGVMAVCDAWSTITSFYPKEDKDVERLKNWLKSLKFQKSSEK